MGNINRKWNFIEKEKRRGSIEAIITFFARERNEDIGIIAAEEVLNFFLQNIGNDIYNKGVEDSKKILMKGFDNLEINLDVLSGK